MAATYRPIDYAFAKWAAPYQSTHRVPATFSGYHFFAAADARHDRIAVFAVTLTRLYLANGGTKPVLIMGVEGSEDIVVSDIAAPARVGDVFVFTRSVPAGSGVGGFSLPASGEGAGAVTIKLALLPVGYGG